MSSNNQKLLRDREEELREIPFWHANKAGWPNGVRTIGMDEIDCLGIDRFGRIYWDGRPVEVKEFKLRWPERTIAITAVSAAVAVAMVDGWEWTCKLEWLSAGLCPLK